MKEKVLEILKFGVMTTGKMIEKPRPICFCGPSGELNKIFFTMFDKDKE
jgi:hypothetical protein